MKKSIIIIFTICALLTGFVLNGMQQKRIGEWHQHEGIIFGTVYHVKYLYSKDLLEEIEAELLQVDASLSMFNKESTISRINRNQTDEADEMLAEVLTLSCAIHKTTGGAFDPTVAPLVNAWGFGVKSGQLPDSTQVDSLRALVGLNTIALKQNRIKKSNPHTILDFSAIAKGFGVDRVAGVLRKHGIQRFMVEIGGEVVTQGLNDKDEPWRIGINKPDDDSTSTQSELQDIVALSDRALATSGNYRNFYIANGRKIAHTINPLSGYPTQQDILSSTVMAPSCAEADAYATAFMVTGMEQAKRILQQQPQLQAYFIYADELGRYQIWCTREFENLIIKN